MIYCYRRDFEAALEQCDQTIELNPHFAPAYLTLGLIQEQRKDFDESAAAFRRAVDLVAALAAHAGRAGPHVRALRQARPGARATLRTLEDLSPHALRVAVRVRHDLLRAGRDSTKGFSWLTKACDDRCFELLAVKVDPRFENLKDEARFAAAAKRIGLG